MLNDKLSLFRNCGCASKKKSIGFTDISVAKNIDLDFETEVTSVRLTGGNGGSTNRQTGYSTMVSTTGGYILSLGTDYMNDLGPVGIGGT